MKIIIRKTDNGWAFDAEEDAEIKAAIADISRNELVIEITKPIKNVQVMADAPAPSFQPGDIVECINNEDAAHTLLRVGERYKIVDIGPYGLLSLEGSGGWKPHRFRKIEPVPAPAPETDEVPGEAEAWRHFSPAGLPWAEVSKLNNLFGDHVLRFRTALRVAIDADRNARGVGGVITREQLETAYKASLFRSRSKGGAMEAGLATLGITVED